MFFLSQINMASESDDTSLHFSNLLLRRCQQEFLKDRNDDEALIHTQKELNTAQDVRATVTGREKQSSLMTNLFPLRCVLYKLIGF